MTSLKGDIINRVRRLPKPTNAAEAMQPVFEAVSNGMHAIEDYLAAGGTKSGSIDVHITLAKVPQDVTVIVSDTGIGLDGERFAAFITTDTDFRSNRGGKGVGRLLWLDAFQKVHVSSTYIEEGRLMRRSFDFVLAKSDQFQNETIETLAKGSAPTGTIVTFSGLRGTAYERRFPSQAAAIIRHFGSHFLAEFILGSSSHVSLTIGDHHAAFPADIQDLLLEERGVSEKDTEEFGRLRIAHFVFRAAASAGFDGNHQLHLIANRRTVMTRKIDGLLGLGRFGDSRKAVYHGCVSAEFLDERVNQERTHFNFDEEVAENIAKVCAQVAMRDALPTEIAEYDSNRLVTMEGFLSDYPSFQFASSEELLSKTPKNATKAEQFAQALIPTRIRRDLERKLRVQKVVSALGEGQEVSGDLATMVKQAADDVRAEEQRQLTEYVLRRKIVLDVLDVLVRRLRDTPSGENDYYLEETLHQFICPMKIRGDDPEHLETSDHDLWIIDERLAFATCFASDVPVSQIVKGSKGAERPDLFIWDHLHGLGIDSDEPLRRVMLVEFKKPGRKDYDEKYAPANQIARYLNALSSGEVESFRNERVRISNDCVFSCYVVADIVGSLEVITSTWRTSADGRGRWTELSGRYRGSIEVIEWRDLLNDARARNAAFIQLAK